MPPSLFPLPRHKDPMPTRIRIRFRLAHHIIGNIRAGHCAAGLCHSIMPGLNG